MSLSKLKSAAELAVIRDQMEESGKKLVFTNGCFDLLHAGHVRYLQQARELGDALLVALNGDPSVRALKGPDRPLNPEADRAEVLCALECVDFVTIFPTVRVTDVIREVKPQVYAKGGDYTPESLDREEYQALMEAGSKIEILGLVPGRSTTSIIQKMSAPKKLRLGVLGSGKGSNFGAIQRRIDAGNLNAEVRIVISDVANAGILDLARSHGIRAEAIKPGKFRTKLEPEIEQRIVDLLKAEQVDFVVLAGYMRMIKAPLLEAFPRQIINIHPSLLPKFPGIESWKQALAAGETKTGCTVHYVDNGMDTGEIIAQSEVPVLPEDTAETLHARIQVAEHELYPAVIATLAAAIK